MPRKKLRFIYSDIYAYLTGKADVPPVGPKGGLLPFPGDCLFMMDDPERYFTPRDDANLPMKVVSASIGPQYVPSRISAYAIGCWQSYQIRGQADKRAPFLQAADWFASAENGLFPMTFSVAHIGLKAPWRSCIAQGQGISVLVRAHAETGEERYLEAALAAARPLAAPVSEGGVLDQTPDGAPFLEEYPNTRHRHVLNGCLFGVVAIHELAQVAPDHPAAHLFEPLVEGIGANIMAWERNGWSLYDYAPRGSDRPTNYNTVAYQNSHTKFLAHVGAISGDQRLTDASERLRRATGRLSSRLGALGGKIAYRARNRW